MLELPNNCRCSAVKPTPKSDWTFSVHPSNWQEAGASTKKDWYIHYRFYDPLFEDNPKYKKGKLVIVKGMNDKKTLSERRQATREIIETELDRLTRLELNPITGGMKIADIDNDEQEDLPEELKELIIPSDTPMMSGLLKVLEISSYTREVKKDIRSVLKYFGMAAKELRLNELPLKDVRKIHIRAILKRCGKIKDIWTNRTFNFYKAHLSMVFSYLDSECVIEANPVSGIKSMEHIPTKRKTLTEEQRIAINDGLIADNFAFWLVMQVFFHSGARTTELLKVRKSDVNLEKQVVQYTVRKGRGGKPRIVTRPIKDIALPYWQLLLSHCDKTKNQYVISEGLRPGDNSIRPEQMTRRWKTWVKDAKGKDGEPKYGEVVADWYSLKASNSTETSGIIGRMLAAKMNQHSEEILKKHYDVDAEERERILMRSVNNAFAPIS